MDRVTDAAKGRFAAFAPVILRHDVLDDGVVFPAGTRGIVVEIHDDGVAYEVEFSHPAEMVLTLTPDDLT